MNKEIRSAFKIDFKEFRAILYIQHGLTDFFFKFTDSLDIYMKTIYDNDSYRPKLALGAYFSRLSLNV